MGSVRVLLHVPPHMMKKIDKWVSKINKEKKTDRHPTTRQAVILAYLDYALEQDIELASGWDRFTWVKGTRPTRT